MPEGVALRKIPRQTCAIKGHVQSPGERKGEQRVTGCLRPLCVFPSTSARNLFDISLFL